tara:strand:- start:214 stop:432 length:219 start_codon:yes stop_codon:yes gene_type:complete
MAGPDVDDQAYRRKSFKPAAGIRKYSVQQATGLRRGEISTADKVVGLAGGAIGPGIVDEPFQSQADCEDQKY